MNAMSSESPVISFKLLEYIFLSYQKALYLYSSNPLLVALAKLSCENKGEIGSFPSSSRKHIFFTFLPVKLEKRQSKLHNNWTNNLVYIPQSAQTRYLKRNARGKLPNRLICPCFVESDF